MKTKLECHAFICTKCSSKRERKSSDKLSDAKSLRDATKKKAKKLFGKSVRINKSGCLGKCDNGIAAVLYPTSKWLIELDREDSDTVIEAIQKELKQNS